jgi:hypothetical protein
MNIGEFSMYMPSKIIAVALMAAAAPWLGSSAAALPVSSPLALQSAVPSSFETVRNRGRGYVGAGIGLAAGAIIGGAILNATQPRGSNGYDRGYNAYGYDNGYNAYGYEQGYGGGYEPGYVEAPSYGYGQNYGPARGYRQGYVAAGGDAAYCQQRYRSYDSASGTYLGYDGLRHPC